MIHYAIMTFIMLLDHWLANTERVIANSILGLLLNAMESIIIAIAKLISRGIK